MTNMHVPLLAVFRLKISNKNTEDKANNWIKTVTRPLDAVTQICHIFEVPYLGCLQIV